MTFRICRLPGDGVGHDVMKAAMIVLDAMNLPIEWIDADAGWCMWEKYGNTVPEQTWEILSNTDACLFGAITSKPGIKGFKSAILQIRQKFDLFANVRPVKAFKGVPLNYRDDIDLVIFRENTEDLYSAIEYYPVPEELIKTHEGFKRFSGKDIAASVRVFSREGCRRILQKAFSHAKNCGHKSATVVHKANVIRQTDGMFLEEAGKISKEYPEIEMWEVNVDAMCMWLIKQPQIYQTIVTTNMFGDIISDEAAQLVGSLGFAASGNIGDKYALFEPSHGSAPKYAGLFKVNPTAMILSAKMMLDWLGLKEAAKKLENSVAKVLEEGKIRTYDLGGQNTTLEMAEAYAKVL